MYSTKRFKGWYIGAVIGATLAFVLWIMPHAPYGFFKALTIACLPCVFGLIGNYVQRKYLEPEE